MDKKQFKYMICDSNKRPTHAFTKTYEYEEIKDEENLSIRLEEPYLIVDVDDDEQFEILRKILRDKKIKTRILKTRRGGHFWFKSMQPMKNVVHANTPITIDIDIKSWGKRTMEIVKLKGEWRKWLQYDEKVDEIPFFLKPISFKKDVMHFKDGDGRDNALFTFVIPLINEQFTKDQIHTVFEMINEYIFDEPLRDDEIEKMFEDNKIFESASGIFYKGSKFQHNIFADYMIKQYKIKGYGNDVYFYHDTMYTNNKDLLISKMIEVIPKLNMSNMREVIENIRLKMINHNTKLASEYINLQNGLYNLETHEFIAHTSEIFTLNQIECRYNPDAYNEDVYNVIRSLACENEDRITLLIQMLGYFLIGDCRFQKSFILLGNGRNGKSMFLDMIRETLGDDNCSSLALEDLSEKFRTAELVGKMINIGDDSGHNLLENTAIFKKLVTGDSITIERKNQNPFKFANKAKMIFAANALPPTTDRSEGFFRRCIVIPFDAVYRETDKDYDPNMIKRITTESAKEYVLLLAIKGLQSLVENKSFAIGDDTRSITEYYELANNNILMWHQTVQEEYDNTKKAFTDYLLYCANNNYRPVSIGKFQFEYDQIKKGLR